MKLKRVTVTNFAGCRHADITASDSDVIVLTGKNEQGKTSFLRALAFGLAGMDKRKSVVNIPVTIGEEKADVTIEAGDYTITRQITADGEETLKVKSADGRPITKPESLLREKFRSVSVNPLEFAEAGQQKQVDMIEKLMTAAVGTELPESIQHIYGKYCETSPQDSVLKKLNQLDSATNGAAYMRRRDLQRDIKNSSAILGDIVVPNENQRKLIDEDFGKAREARAASEEAVETINLIDTIAREITLKLGIIADAVPETAQNRHVLFWKNLINDVRDNHAGIVELLQKLSNVEKEAVAEEQRCRDRRTKYEASVEQYNKAQKQREIHNANLNEVEIINNELAAIDAYRKQVLSQLSLPVPGLSVTGGAVFVRGVPYAQASAARRTAISIALGMATVKEDGLRLMLVENGAFIGEEIFAEIASAAAKNDYTVILERPSEESEVGYVFSNGTARKGNA